MADKIKGFTVVNRIAAQHNMWESFETLNACDTLQKTANLLQKKNKIKDQPDFNTE